MIDQIQNPLPQTPDLGNMDVRYELLRELQEIHAAIYAMNEKINEIVEVVNGLSP